MKKITAVLCGAGGYGALYVRALLREGVARGLDWVGVVEPFPERVERRDEIAARGIPWYAGLDDFYRERGADLCVIAAPIQFHAGLSIEALRAGSHVLCEKPIAALPSEAQAMTAARDAAGKLLLVGYQWSYAPPVRALKRDIAAGFYGAPIDLSSLLLWPRGYAYYARGVGWAGKARDAAGRWVLDSVASNATAHYLHNMLYILGAEGGALMPDTLTASLYRANPIEMYDTAFIEARAGGGAAIRFIATHASHRRNNVVSRYAFEDGTVCYDGDAADGGRFIGRLKDGRVIDYGSPRDCDEDKLWSAAEAVRALDDGRQPDVPCPIEAALPHNRCMIASLLSGPIGDFPDELVCDVEATRYAVDGLDDVCEAVYARGEPLRAGDAPWARAGRAVRCDDPAIDAYGVAP